MGAETPIKLPYLAVSMTSLPESQRQQSVAERSLTLLRSGAEFGYGHESRTIIGRALHIATTHEINTVEDRRSRKFDKEPYIFHPLAMAQEAMRMRQHPTIVAACLMHDVPEDIKLGGLRSAEQWMNHIESAFARYPHRDRLMRILKAEQKTESIKDKPEIINYYMNTTLGKTALGYLESLRGNRQVSEMDKQHIAEVLFDLNRMVDCSFIEGTDNEKHFDPSVMIVKILDTWQNLQTPGFWKTQAESNEKDARTVAKLIRARILTNVAEFLGMRRVASDMTKAIATLHDIDNADSPNLTLLRKLSSGNNGEKTEWEQRYEAIEARLHTAKEDFALLRPQLPGHERDTIDTVLQMPWAAQTADTFTTPTGQTIHYVNSDRSLRILPSAQNMTRGYYLDTEPVADTHALRALFYREMGRSVYDYAVKNAQGNTVARVRAEAPSPRYISTTKDHAFNPPPVGAVPERNLFHPDICKYTTKTKEESTVPDSLKDIDTRHVRLLEFMLSPQTFLTHANGEKDRPYVIMMNGKVFLAANTTDVALWDMAQGENIPNPRVRAASSDKTSSISIRRNDAHVLDRMVRAKHLPLRIVIVEAGAPKKASPVSQGVVYRA